MKPVLDMADQPLEYLNRGRRLGTAGWRTPVSGIGEGGQQ